MRLEDFLRICDNDRERATVMYTKYLERLDILEKRSGLSFEEYRK